MKTKILFMLIALGIALTTCKKAGTEPKQQDPIANKDRCKSLASKIC